jgi:eukaryotic-like serine/threonine-protein kinase
MPKNSPSSILPGQIGRFRVISELGKGAQGIVYLATDTQLERNVAIKTILLEKPSPRIKAQLLTESRTVSKLQHPGIITLYEADEHLGKPYLVFEYVDGTSLHEYLQSKGKIPAKEAIHFMDSILNAIAYAHKRSVIHRDLTPHNIMLTDGNNKPRLMDFGIATLLGNQTDDGLWGTLKYLSPEQCENKPAIAASDIFTLGIILYEMLTGTAAFEGDNKFATVNRILNEEIKIPDNIDPGLKPIIKKALEKNPEARYNDALDMRQDLLDHLNKIAPEPDNQPNDTQSENTTLQFLLRRMEHKKDFPAMSHQVIEISQKAKSGGGSSANALSNAILRDYSLSTKLLRLVNSPMYGSYGGRISTVSRAVVILGFEEVRNAALGLMLLDHLKDKNQAASLKEATIESMMSGNIANGLAQELKLKDVEEAYVCSMFHNLGKLLAIYYFPEEMEVIIDHVKHNGMKEEHAVQSVLGVSYEEIGIAVGESWALPHEIVESMHPLPAGELKKALSQSDLLKHVSGFSNEYCALMSSTSSEDKEQSFESLASRFSNTLSISKKQMEGILNSAIDEMQKYAELVNLDLTNSSIFKKASTWSTKTTKEIEGLISAPEKKEHADPTDALNKQETIIHATQEITDAILEGASLNDILVMVMETIYSGFGYSRVMFCFINKSRTSINARFGFGKDAETIINRFSIPRGGDKDIFNQALNQCDDLIIEDVKEKSNADLVPEWYRKKYAKKSMLIYPIVVKNIPLGILFIDSIAPVSICDENSLSMLRTLRNQIVLAIRQCSL